MIRRALVVPLMIACAACGKNESGGGTASTEPPTAVAPIPAAVSGSAAPRGRIKYPLAGWKQSQESSNRRTSEAKQTVGAIARAAIAAYERETSSDPAATTTTHRMCKSAQQVPFAVPREKKYQPDSSLGADYDAGNADTGWKCLRFSMTMPHYYQYAYIQGGPYKGPRRGGPDPGPDGFEASAEGDLDGDGVTSLFTLVGVVENGELRKEKSIFMTDPDE
jgi:hypothetical protein